MALDIKRLDERIQKLQELRRIAADPEMVKLLAEFLTQDDGAAAAAPAPGKALAAEAAAPASPKPDEVSQFVKGVLEGTEAVRPGNSLPGWNSRKS